MFSYKQIVKHLISRELFPLPQPFEQAARIGRSSGLSKSVISRVNAKAAWQRWANDGVESLNGMYGGSSHVVNQSTFIVPNIDCTIESREHYFRSEIPADVTRRDPN